MRKSEAAHNIVFLPGLGDDFLGFVRIAAWAFERKYKNYLYPVHCFVHLLNWGTYDYAQVEESGAALAEFAREKNEAGETLTMMGISAGVPVCFKLGIEHPELFQNLLLWDGWINDIPELQHESNAAFVTAVRTLNAVLDKTDQKTLETVRQKAHFIHPERDTRVPLDARIMPDSINTQIPYYSHLAATTIGLLWETQSNRIIQHWLLREKTRRN